MEDLKDIKNIDDYCQQVRQQLDNGNLSPEQVKDLCKRFTVKVEGYCAGKNSIIDDLKKCIDDFKARFEFMQGNNVAYAYSILDLELNILKFINTECENIIATFKNCGDLITGNVFKLQFEKVTSHISACFYNYLYNGKQSTNTQLKGGVSNEKE